MNIIIKKHLLLYKGYKLKCSIGKSGITASKMEGDLASPKGIFELGLLYYRKDRIKSLKCRIKKRIIKELKLFPKHKLTYYEDLDSCIKDSTRLNSLVIFFIEEKNKSFFYQNKINNFPSILISESSTSASPSPFDADVLSGPLGGASATVKSVKEKGLNSLSFNMVRTMIQDL